MFSCELNDEVQLRMLEQRHADELYRLTDRNRNYLRTWLPWVDATNSKQDTMHFIEASLKQYANHNGFNCGIFYRNTLVGCIGYNGIDWPNKKTAIGYWLAEPYQGKGIMTNCCKELVRYALEELNLNRVEIRAGVENYKSRAIPERLGFKQEGILRQAEWVNHRFIDHAVYSMLAEEWTKI